MCRRLTGQKIVFLVGLRSADVFGISEPVGKEGKLGVQKAEKTICSY